MTPSAELPTVSPVDPHMDLLRQWRETEAVFIETEEDSREAKQAWDKRVEIGRIIATTPARTLEGVMAQLDYWLDDWSGSFCANSTEVGMIRSIRDGILAGAALPNAEMGKECSA